MKDFLINSYNAQKGEFEEYKKAFVDLIIKAQEKFQIQNLTVQFDYDGVDNQEKGIEITYIKGNQPYQEHYQRDHLKNQSLSKIIKFLTEEGVFGDLSMNIINKNFIYNSRFSVNEQNLVAISNEDLGWDNYNNKRRQTNLSTEQEDFTKQIEKTKKLKV